MTGLTPDLPDFTVAVSTRHIGVGDDEYVPYLYVKWFDEWHEIGPFSDLTRFSEADFLNPKAPAAAIVSLPTTKPMTPEAAITQLWIESWRDTA